MAEVGLRSDGQAHLRRGETYYTEKVFMGQTSEGIRQAFHYEFPGKLELLKSLVSLCASIKFRKTSNILIVNIGAGAGTSGLAFLETSLPPNKSDVTLHTVDITAESSPFGSLHSEQVVCEEAGRRRKSLFLRAIRKGYIHKRIAEDYGYSRGSR